MDQFILLNLSYTKIIGIIFLIMLIPSAIYSVEVLLQNKK